MITSRAIFISMKDLMIKKVWFFAGCFLFGVAGCISWKFLKPKKGYVRFPIELIANTPCVAMSAEGHSFSVELDTGMDRPFALRTELLDRLNGKQEDGIAQSWDINHNEYHSFSFVIPEIIWEAATITKMSAKEENIYFLTQGSFLQSPLEISERTQEYLDKVSGRMGLECLLAAPYCWFFDLPHRELYLIRDLNKAVKRGQFSLEGFVEVPLEIINSKLIVSLETDFGWKRFVVDTGASVSLLKADSDEANHKWLKTERFGIQGTDFGSWEFYLFDFSELLEADGILGVDFLGEHALFLDLKNQKAWISSGNKDALTIEKIS